VQSASQALQKRRQYLQFYRAIHVRQPGFVNAKRDFKKIAGELLGPLKVVARVAKAPSCQCVPSCSCCLFGSLGL
jgi:hypothetical protein